MEEINDETNCRVSRSLLDAARNTSVAGAFCYTNKGVIELALKVLAQTSLATVAKILGHPSE